jgi:hypothetical protein
LFEAQGRSQGPNQEISRSPTRKEAEKSGIKRSSSRISTKPVGGRACRRRAQNNSE